MADEKTKQYVLVADGMRHEDRRFQRGDTVELPADVGDRLVESGSLREPGDDDPQTDPAATTGLAPVADEASTTGAAQSVDEDGEIKPESFGHPDQVKAAEEAAAEQERKADAAQPPAARRRRGAAEGDTARTSER